MNQTQSLLEKLQEKHDKSFLPVAFFIGLIIPIIGYLIDFYHSKIPFSLSNIPTLYAINPLHYIILLSPIFFLLFAYIFKRINHQRKQEEILIVLEEKDKNDVILNFIESLKNVNESTDYTLQGDEDKLGMALLDLRNNLSDSQQQNILRKKEDDQRNWTAEGLALFGEILRKDNDNIEILSYNIIKNLDNYLNVNQGAFFIINDNDITDKHFEMTACYAYDRRKFADKRLEWGEGLVGTCALERQTIYMTEVPQTYIRITSGLGKATPKSLLLVPLVINDEVHGVIELASFRKLESFEISFAEKVAESIASTISSVKINLRTSKLLAATQEQADTLATQEEQMRQNMEELQATQEEAARQSEKFISFTNSVNHTLIRAEYSMDGTLLYANTKFLKKLGYQFNSEVEGKHISIFIHNKDRVWFDPIWEELARGGRHFEGDMKHLTKQGQDLWTMATYTCVRTEDGAVEKILFLAIDTTEQKKQSLDYEGQMEALNRSGLKAEFSPEGKFLDSNNLFLDSIAYSSVEAKEKSIFDFIVPQDKKQMNEIWKNALNGIPFQGQIRFLTRTKKEKWYRTTFTAVNDMYNEIAKIIFIAFDVTKEKMMEIEVQQHNAQLKIQEEKLRTSGEELIKKLEDTKNEMRQQFKEIEMTKIRNERTLEGALDAIVTINGGGTIEFFNHAAEELWALSRDQAIGKHIKTLFSQQTIANDDFVARYIDNQREKTLGKRQEVTITTADGKDISVLILLSEAKVGQEHSFTAFIQNIEVELF